MLLSSSISSIFSTGTAVTVTVTQYLACLGVALLLGLVVALVSRYKNKKVPVSFTRSGLTADSYSTVCLPVDFTKPDNCTFYELQGFHFDESENVWVADVSETTTLKAHTPYIFKCTGTEVTFSGTISKVAASYGDTDLTANAVNATIGTDQAWSFIGTYTALDWTTIAPTEPTYGFSIYVPSAVGAGTFAPFVTGASLAPFRARLIYSGSDTPQNATTRGATSELPQYFIVRIVGSNGVQGTQVFAISTDGYCDATATAATSFGGIDYYTSGTEVTLNHDSRTGYEFDRYCVKDGSDNDIYTTTISGSTLTMPASNVTIYATWKKLLTNTDIKVSAIADQTYTGEALTPAVTVKDGETDITAQCDITYQNNTNVGTATVTIKAKAASTAYSSETSTTFEITEPPVPGDANGDKVVNAADIVKLVKDGASQSDIDAVVKIIMKNK